MRKLKTAVVVLNYNDFKTTLQFVENIKDYKSISLIVIVDNASTDNSYEKLKCLNSSRIKVIKTDKNGGYGYGNNVGIKYAIKELGKCNIIISNPDIEVSDDTIKNLTTKLDEENDWVMIAPIVIENGTENRGWKLPSVLDDVLQNIPYFHRYFKKLQLYNSKWYNKKYVEVDCVSGCFFIIKSEAMEKIKYFDENLFLYYEENVIGKKIKMIGKKVIIDTSSSIIHHHSVSVNKSINNLKKYKILKESQIYYHSKYNKASILGKSMLYLTNKITQFVLYIYYSFK